MQIIATLKKVKKIMAVGLFAILQASCSVFGIQNEEGPQYEVLLKQESKEIRSYSGYVVASTEVEKDFENFQNEAFRILAGYIFGANVQKEKISMTSPVLQSSQNQISQAETSQANTSPAKTSEQIAMTAPVIQTSLGKSWKMSFMMPSKYKIDDLPTPIDSRIKLSEVAPKIVAVIRFTGFGNEKNNAKYAQQLKKWLNEIDQYEALTEPAYAGYNPPWTIPFLRRNEVMIEVRKK